MLIDWFTVGAQFINFIVLVLLMKRFLYRPILEAMAAREQRIAAAREEVLSLQTRWHEAFAKEKDQLRHDLTLRVQAEVLAIARCVLKELASTSLEEAIARQFTRQLQDLPDQ